MSDATSGILIVDKPAGMTSHDVVGQVRRLAGTRRVGHAGTLDPMATGVLVIGINQATRLLGHLTAHDKDYTATIRLGATTTTDDREGDIVEEWPLVAVDDADILVAMTALTGDIEQVPPAVSAIKVDGVRSYKRARDGESVPLAPRPVTVSAFELLGRRGDDLDVRVTCSAGTYIRSLARDLGAMLGVGGHLAALRRTRSGSFDESGARPLDTLDPMADLIPMSRCAADAFAVAEVDDSEAARVRFGQRRVVPSAPPDASPVAIVDVRGELVALVEMREGVAHPLAVFA